MILPTIPEELTEEETNVKITNIINKTKDIAIEQIEKYTKPSLSTDIDNTLKYDPNNNNNIGDFGLSFFINFVYFIFSPLIWICVNIFSIIVYLLKKLHDALSYFAEDYKLFNIFDEKQYKNFLLLDIFKKEHEDYKEKSYQDEENKTFIQNNAKDIKNIKSISDYIKGFIDLELLSYKNLCSDYKQKYENQKQSENNKEEYLKKLSNQKDIARSEISSKQKMFLANTTAGAFSKFINFLMYALEWVKLFIIALLYILKALFLSFGTKYNRAWSGFIILLIIIAVIIYVIFDAYAPKNDINVNRNSSQSKKNRPNDNRFNYNNTNIFDALNRLPSELYSLVDDINIFYTEFSNKVTFFMKFSSEIIEDTRNLAQEPIEYPRTKNQNTDGICDNIYTFEKKYLNIIFKEKIHFPENTDVIHLILPNNPEKFGTTSNVLKPDIIGEYYIDCESNVELKKFFNEKCIIRKDLNGGSNCIENTGVGSPEIQDYNNII